MCDAISLSLRELPTRYQEHPGIKARVVDRGGDLEAHFYLATKPAPPLIPTTNDEEFRTSAGGTASVRASYYPTVAWFAGRT